MLRKIPLWAWTALAYAAAWWLGDPSIEGEFQQAIFGIDDAILIGLGGSLLGGAASGAMGGLFGGGDEEGPVVGPMSPATPFISSLFNTVQGRRGIFAPRFRGQQHGIFSELPSQLEELFTPLPLDPLETLGFDLGETFADRFDPSVSLLDQILPFAGELAETGFRTDISPVIGEAQRRFTEDFIPAAKEVFSGSTGVFGTPLTSTIGREGARISSELGALQAELNEAAALRRITGLQAAPAIASAALGLPLNFARDIAGFGTTRRGIEESLRPGARAFDVMTTLANISNQTPFIQQGFNPADTGTAALGALSEIVPAAVGSGAGGGLGGLFSRGLQGLQGLFSSPTPTTAGLFGFG